MLSPRQPRLRPDRHRPGASIVQRNAAQAEQPQRRYG